MDCMKLVNTKNLKVFKELKHTRIIDNINYDEIDLLYLHKSHKYSLV